MAITFNHNDKLYVSGSNVGIGTDSPSSILHLENAGNTWAKFINTSGTNQRLDVGTNSSSQHFVFGYGDYPVLFGSNGAERMRITSGGNVGIGTTSPSGKLHVVGGRSYFTPSGDSDSATNSHVIDIYNANDTAFTADALAAYNAHTSWDIGSRSTYTISSRANNGSIYTFAGEHASASVAINRYVQLNSDNDSPLLNWTFYQWDGAGTAATDLKVPNKVWTVQSYQSGGSDTLLILNGDGTLQLSQYGAGVLTTDSAGNVGVSTGYQTQSTADSRYVNVTGDTMTGQLIIQKTGDFTAAKFKGTAADGYGQITVENDLGTALILGSMGSTKTGTFFDNARYIGATSGELVLKTYSSTDGHMKFLSGGQNERMRITAGGNVGIGTTSPTYKLDVYGSARIGGSNGDVDLVIEADADNSGENDNPRLILKQDGGLVSGIIGLNGDADNAFTGALGNGMYISAYDALQLRGGSGGIVTIDANGNVGIGTTSPGAILEVSDTTTGIAAIIGNTTHNSRLQIYTAAVGKNSEIWFGDAADDDIGKIDYDHADNSLSFFTNTAEAMRITSTGNVGIGTTSPSRDLHIVKSNDGGQVRFQIINTSNTADSTSVISIYNGGADGGDPFLHWKIDVQQDWSMGIDNSDGDKLKISKNFGPGTNDYLTVDTSGNVGIGTTSPTHLLTLETASSPGIKIKDTTQGNTLLLFSQDSDSHVGTYSSHPLVFDTNSTERMRITSAGNVGIGTTSPSEKLHVAGSGLFDVQSLAGGTKYYIAKGLGTTSGGPNSGYGVYILLEYYATDDRTTFGTIVGTRSGSASAPYVEIKVRSFVDQSSTTNRNVSIECDSAPFNTVEAKIVTYDSVDYTAIYIPEADANRHPNRWEFTGWHSQGGNSLKAINGNDANITNVDALTSNKTPVKHLQSDLYVTENVGIGTTSPANKLHVYGGRLVLDNAANAQSAIQINSAGSEKIVIYRPTSTEDLRIYTPAAGDAFALTQAGNVGIGTTSPGSSYKLDVEGNTRTNGYHVLGATGDIRDRNTHNQRFEVSSTYSSIKTSNTHRLYVTSAGNVGIGTTSPGIELDVAGGIRATAGTANGLRVHTNSGITASSNYMNFFTSQSSGWAFNANGTGADSDTKVVITASGNVGIGTTSPGAKLTIVSGGKGIHVDKGSHSSTSANLSECRTNYAFAYDTLRNGSTTGFFITNVGTNTPAMQAVDSSNNAQDISIQPYGGNVGIGTTSPGAKLHINSSASDGIIVRTTANVEPFIAIQRNSGTNGVAVLRGIDGGHLYLDTGATGAAQSTKIVVSASGNVGIGTTAPQQALHIKGTTNGLMMLEGDNDNGIAGCYYKTEDTDDTMNRTKGFFGFQGNNTWGLGYFTMWLDNVGDNGQVTSSEERFRWQRDGDFHADGDVIAYSTTTPSDIRLKTDVETIESASEKVSKLRGVEYTWSKGKLAGQREIGLIAQEVEAVVPEVVKEKELPLWDDSGESYKTVDYEKLVALLIESNKEMQEEIKQLKERLDGFTK